MCGCCTAALARAVATKFWRAASSPAFSGASISIATGRFMEVWIAR
jgi:hypothetical protein